MIYLMFLDEFWFSFHELAIIELLLSSLYRSVEDSNNTQSI